MDYHWTHCPFHNLFHLNHHHSHWHHHTSTRWVHIVCWCKGTSKYDRCSGTITWYIRLPNSKIYTNFTIPYFKRTGLNTKFMKNVQVWTSHTHIWPHYNRWQWWYWWSCSRSTILLIWTHSSVLILTVVVSITFPWKIYAMFILTLTNKNTALGPMLFRLRYVWYVRYARYVRLSSSHQAIFILLSTVMIVELNNTQICMMYDIYN